MIMNYLRFIGERATFNSKTWGPITVESVSFTPAADGDLVAYIGDIKKQERVYVRIHSECVFAEAFDSDFCDCAEQFKMAMNKLVQTGGVLFYLRFDGRGAGLSAKVKATALEVQGMDTYQSRLEIGVPPEGRDFTKIGEYLLSRDIKKITLLTNSPNKISDLRNAGVDVETEPLFVGNPNPNIRKLYETKVKEFGHKISVF